MRPASRLRAALAGIGLLVLVTAGGAARSAEAIIHFAIPAGSLDTVLTDIGAAGHLSIAFPANLTQGLQAGPIQGDKTVRAAIDEALAGTRLVQIGSEGGSVTIRAVERDGAAPFGAAPTRLAAGGIAAEGARLDLPDIDIAGQRSRFGDRGFQAGDAGQTTRLGNAPAREVPIAVVSVTEDVIRSQSVISPTAALTNVSGVTVTPTNLGANAFTIRGFSTNTPFVDGDPSSGSFYSRLPVDDIDRIDVLKGTTSLLSGITANGGLVNLVTKTPTDRTIHEATVRYGSYGYKTLAFDLGGAVPQTEGLTYRLNLSGNVADKSYAGYRSPHQYLIAPAVEWQDRTFDVLLGARYVDTKAALPLFTFVPIFLPADETSIVRLPRGIPQDGPDRSLQSSAAALYANQAARLIDTGDFRLIAENHTQLQYQRTFEDFFVWNQLLTDNARSVYPLTEAVRSTDLAERADLVGTYTHALFRQTSKIGYDNLSLRPSVAYQYGSPVTLDGASGLPEPASSGGQASPTIGANLTTDSGIYYLEKFDTVGDRLHIVGNVRHDLFTVTNSSPYGSSGFHQNALSWLAGGAFDVTPILTVYGNRSIGYLPQYAISSSSPPPPQRRDSSEVGARSYLFDHHLTLAAAFFTLQQTNVGIGQPGDLTGTRSILVPGEASRGFEFEAQGQLFDGLNVILAFADVHAAFKDQNFANILQGVPQLTGSFWATYTFQNVAWRGFTVGFGVHGNSSSRTSALFSGLPDAVAGVSFPLPGYVIEDAMISYAHDNYSLSLKLNNLTNCYYFYPTVSSDQIGVGEGRNFLLVAQKSF